MRAVALGHQRAGERLAVDRAPDLHEPTSTKQLGHIGHQYARPSTSVVTLLKLGIELSQHACCDSRTRRDSSPSGPPKSLRCRAAANIDAVTEEPRARW